VPAETRNRQYGALLRGVESRVRSFLSDTAPDGNTPGKYCGITAPPGRPPSWAGSVWYSVFHRGMAGEGKSPQYHERVYGVGICLTVRVNAKPQDRIGNSIILAIDEGIADRVDALAEYLHGDYDTMHLVNQYMRSAQTASVDTEQGFVEPLLFQGATDPTEQGPNWFGSDPTKAGGAASAGYSVTLNFGGARYIKAN
jgi:hypothetical protein